VSEEKIARPLGHGPGGVTLSPSQFSVPAGSLWARLPWIAGIVGLVGIAASAVIGWGTEQFFFSWLVSYLYFLSIALGGLFFVLALFVTKAGWGVVVRRVPENVMSTLPLFAVLFIPIWLGRHELFHWTHEEAVATDAILQAKAPYLNGGFFLGRAVAYFVIWALLSWWFAAQSRRQDESGDHAITRRLQYWSGPSIFLFALTTSFAAFDWIMSLDPHWYSTIFGVYFFAGALVGVFAFQAIVFIGLEASGLLRNVVNTEHFHDMGKLLFAFTVFWAYIAFSQYFLIWYGNIPEETIWFEHRLAGSWESMSLLLAAGHFVVPFFFLMPRTIKRNRVLLLLGAVWMLLMHFVDLFWCVMPVLHHHGFHLGLLDVTTFLGIGGLFISVFSRLLARHALIPVKDPRLPESLAFENM
jgi:hypothetical protein